MESQDAVIRKFTNKIIESESIRDEMHEALDIREKKIESLEEQFKNLQETILKDLGA